MKNFFFLAIFSILLASCNNDSASNEGLASAIETFKNEPSNENKNALILAAEKEITSSENIGSVFNQTVGALREKGLSQEAVNWMSQVLKEHVVYPDRANNLMTLADVWEKDLKKPTQASLIRQGVLNTYPQTEGLETYKAGLENVPPIDMRLRSFAKKIFSDSTASFNKSVAREFVMACENFVLSQPKDSLCPQFLIDAATISRNLGEKEQVIDLFQWVYMDYPNSPKAGDAKFMEAFTYDSDLKDYDRARESYETFINSYPQHPFAESAKAMLANLGKSDEEILKELEAKNQ
ncbi:MAG: hypothetical protein R2879_04135 [Saprospiraceae bacterium]